jgi:5-methyltetrahydrofolate--homocysteine methyltransferase
MLDSNKVLLKQLAETVIKHDDNKMDSLLSMVVAKDIALTDIRQSIVIGLEETRSQIMANSLSMAEFLVCLDTAIKGLESPLLLKNGEKIHENGNVIVIGVVEGDPHDFGKTIIAGVYKAYGYKVIDLGSNVSTSKFIKSIKQYNANILAISAMMSTTTANVKEVISEAKSKSNDLAVIVGGAYMNKKLAKSYGADGYSETALTAIEYTEAMLNNEFI